MYNVLENDNIRLELTISYRDNYYYKAYDKSNNYVGNCGLRLSETEANYYLGNIEYEVFEPYRGHHYSVECCKLLLNIAHDYHLDNIVITTNPMNEASKHIINSLDGKFIEVVKVPKKSVLYRQGDRYIERYSIETR